MIITPGQALIAFDAHGIAHAPSKPGVYALCAVDGGYLFFGHAEDLRKRLTEHLDHEGSCIHRAGAVFFAYEVHASMSLRVARQIQLVMKYATPCNLGVVGA